MFKKLICCLAICSVDQTGASHWPKHLLPQPKKGFSRHNDPQEAQQFTRTESALSVVSTAPGRTKRQLFATAQAPTEPIPTSTPISQARSTAEQSTQIPEIVTLVAPGLESFTSQHALHESEIDDLAEQGEHAIEERFQMILSALRQQEANLAALPKVTTGWNIQNIKLQAECDAATVRAGLEHNRQLQELHHKQALAKKRLQIAHRAQQKQGKPSAQTWAGFWNTLKEQACNTADNIKQQFVSSMKPKKNTPNLSIIPRDDDDDDGFIMVTVPVNQIYN